MIGGLRFVSLGLLLIACTTTPQASSTPQAPMTSPASPTPEPPTTAGSTFTTPEPTSPPGTPELTPSPDPTDSTTPEGRQPPPPADLSARPLTWFAPLPPMPGRTGSADFMDQFEVDAEWTAAAEKLHVYKLYGEWVAYHATDAQLATAVAGIARRGLALAIEVGPLDPPPDCGQFVEGFAGTDEGRRIASRVADAGGRIDVLALDEPYYFGHLYDGEQACHLPVAEIAQDVAAYVATMRGYFPELVVGDTEPTPVPVTAAGLGEWLDAYETAAGEDFAFLHLDLDWSRAQWETLAHRIQDVSTTRDVPLGIIYNGGSAPEREQWIHLAGDRLRAFESTGPAADHAVFQSWMVQPDRVLPETDASTFSGLLRTYFEDPDGLGTPAGGPGANLALDRPARASSSAADGPAGNAVDGDFDTIWNAGAGPRQWIEIELDGRPEIGTIRLHVAQFPEGRTNHRVLGRSRNGDLAELHTFAGVTADADVLEFVPVEALSDLIAIRIETRFSPSFVAWREIEILAP